MTTTVDYEVEITWLRLRRLASVVAIDGDPDFQGHNWGKRALASLGKHRFRAGLDTTSRVFWWDAMQALAALERSQLLVAELIAAQLLIPLGGRGPKGTPRPKRPPLPRLLQKHVRGECRDRLRVYGRQLLVALIDGEAGPAEPACACDR